MRSQLGICAEGQSIVSLGPIPRERDKRSRRDLSIRVRVRAACGAVRESLVPDSRLVVRHLVFPRARYLRNARRGERFTPVRQGKQAADSRFCLGFPVWISAGDREKAHDPAGNASRVIYYADYLTN